MYQRCISQLEVAHVLEGDRRADRPQAAREVGCPCRPHRHRDRGGTARGNSDVPVQRAPLAAARSAAAEGPSVERGTVGLLVRRSVASRTDVSVKARDSARGPSLTSTAASVPCESTGSWLDGLASAEQLSPAQHPGLPQRPPCRARGRCRRGPPAAEPRRAVPVPARSPSRHARSRSQRGTRSRSTDSSGERATHMPSGQARTSARSPPTRRRRPAGRRGTAARRELTSPDPGYRMVNRARGVVERASEAWPCRDEGVEAVVGCRVVVAVLRATGGCARRGAWPPVRGSRSRRRRSPRSGCPRSCFSRPSPRPCRRSVGGRPWSATSSSPWWPASTVRVRARGGAPRARGLRSRRRARDHDPLAIGSLSVRRRETVPTRSSSAHPARHL